MSDKKRPERIVQAIYKELKKGDFRKGVAKSNDADTGGGARDLRFGGYAEVKDIFRSFLPERRTENRHRNKKPVALEILTGTGHWVEPLRPGEASSETERTRTFEVEFEEPTYARPTEGRLTRVNKYPFFGRDDYLPADDKSRRFLLISRSESGLVYFHIVSEKILRIPDPEGRFPFNKTMVDCINAKRNANVSVLGHYDFENGMGYCNGK